MVAWALVLFARCGWMIIILLCGWWVKNNNEHVVLGAKGRRGQPLSPQATKLRGLGNVGCCADRDGSKSELLKNFALLSSGPTAGLEETRSELFLGETGLKIRPDENLF
jgi:hypothetical protein